MDASILPEDEEQMLIREATPDLNIALFFLT
jgi:hypothetical protein